MLAVRAVGRSTDHDGGAGAVDLTPRSLAPPPPAPEGALSGGDAMSVHAEARTRTRAQPSPILPVQGMRVSATNSQMAMQGERTTTLQVPTGKLAIDVRTDKEKRKSERKKR